MGVALLLFIAVPVLEGLFASHSIPDDVAQGFHLWQSNDCAGCHTLAGQGGGHASDLIHIYSLRGEAYLRDFLLNPDAFYPHAIRAIPHIAESETYVSLLLAFLKWTDENTVLPLPQTTDENIRSFRSHSLDLPSVPK
jgi:hypothetical protein